MACERKRADRRLRRKIGVTGKQARKQIKRSRQKYGMPNRYRS